MLSSIDDVEGRDREAVPAWRQTSIRQRSDQGQGILRLRSSALRIDGSGSSTIGSLMLSVADVVVDSTLTES
jgi:hypothetical protein